MTGGRAHTRFLIYGLMYFRMREIWEKVCLPRRTTTRSGRLEILFFNTLKSSIFSHQSIGTPFLRPLPAVGCPVSFRLRPACRPCCRPDFPLRGSTGKRGERMRSLTIRPTTVGFDSLFAFLAKFAGTMVGYSCLERSKLSCFCW